MVLALIGNKLKHFFLFFVGLFRRALCCFRRRRRPSFDAVPLTDVGVVSNSQNVDLEGWNWEERPDFSEPKTVQDHIDLYRKKKSEAQKQAEEGAPENFFEDMTPRITRQTKVLVNTGRMEGETTNGLNFVPTTPLEDGELREWEESSGWEGETLDWDAQEALRQKKRQDRERRLWEQQQKRLEKHRTLGEKLNT